MALSSNRHGDQWNRIEHAQFYTPMSTLFLIKLKVYNEEKTVSLINSAYRTG